VSPLNPPDAAADDGETSNAEPIFELLQGDDDDTGAAPENRAVGGTAQAYRLSGLARSDRRSGRPFALMTPPAASVHLTSSTLDASRLSNSNPGAGGLVTQESSLARSVNDWMAEVSCHFENDGAADGTNRPLTPSANAPTPPSPALLPATARADHFNELGHVPSLERELRSAPESPLIVAQENCSTAPDHAGAR
jgi:hypothetical protein